jgi:ribonucleoside-diphosphate reductase alpha chain
MNRGEREHLPSRRNCLTQKFKITDEKGKVTTGYLQMGDYPDGRLGEIWLIVDRCGSALRGFLDSFAQQVSVSLQSGTPLTAVIRMMLGTQFEPSGKVWGWEGGSPEVSQCKSIVDFVAQQLTALYCTADDIKELRKHGVIPQAPSQETKSTNGTVPGS